MSVLRDIVIVGAGHNALVTAFYLARAGFKPLVLERRDIVGGAAISEEFHPGFRCSTLAHSAGPLRRDILRDMRLDRRGIHLIEPQARVTGFAADGRPLTLFKDPGASSRDIGAFSSRDAARYPEFQTTMGRVAQFVGALAAATPPAIDRPTPADYWSLARTGRRFRALNKRDQFRLLRWTPMAIADLAAEWFETDLLRAIVAARGIFGSFAGPWSAFTGTAFLWRSAGDEVGTGGTSFVQGGLGALTRAMASAATAAGAEIRTDAGVARIDAADGSVTGVTLATGEQIAARAVISGADPRRTFLNLLDPVHLDPDFLMKIRSYRCLGAMAKVNLALAALPAFRALESLPEGERSARLSGRIHVGPGIDYLERAFDAAKYGRMSDQPYLDATIPSLTDSALAPPGQHVMSICMQFAPYALRGTDWTASRDALGDLVVKTLAEYAPGFEDLVLHRQVITPRDLEEVYGLSGGHIFHGELAPDQLFTMRPVLGWARYRTPLKNLYLCGSGTHPGDGVTGASGANAAREILRDVRRPGKG